MSVVIETTLGDITVDLFLSERPRACLNFLKLCKIKYYNYNLFHTISRGFIAQTGDPTGSRSGGESIFGILDGPLRRYFEGENEPRIKHTKMGLISFVGNEDRMIGSQFFLTLGEDLMYLDEKHCVFGEVVEGFDILEVINEVICDTDDRPYQDVRITHTVVLDDPYPDPKRLVVPSRSPSPTPERLQGGRIAPDEDIDETEGKTAQEIAEMQAEREAKARATILEMVGDLPDAEMAPPENVLFVCKLNPVTTDDDLEIIFSRFGKIKSCEVIRDKKTGDSLQYAFVEFETQKSCEDAYFKMDNVLIDDRRIHVDFSQSVSKVKWHGKGRGVTHYDEKGRRSKENSDIGKGNYNYKRNNNYNRDSRNKSPDKRSRSRSPRNNENSRRTVRTASNDRSKSRKEYKSETDPSTSPKRKRDFISPKRSESKNNRDYRSTREVEIRSRKYRDRSLSPKRKDTTTSRRYRENSSSSKREHSDSRSYQDNRRNYKEKSKSPSSSGRRNKYESSNIRYSRTELKSKTVSSREPKGSSPSDRRETSVTTTKSKLKTRDRKRSSSSSDSESRKPTKKKKNVKSSSESSESDSDNKIKKKKRDSTDSSDSSDYKTKKHKKKKAAKKVKYETSSDSDDYKKKKSKKKKKKYKSDSD